MIYLYDVLVGSKNVGRSHPPFGSQLLLLATLQFETDSEKVHFRRSRDWASRLYHFCGNIKPGKEKTQDEKDFPAPKSVNEIQRFTGFTNYFRVFIPMYAKLAGKQTKLIAKETGWGGGDLPSDALEACKCLCKKNWLRPHSSLFPSWEYHSPYWQTLLSNTVMGECSNFKMEEIVQSPPED